MEVEKTDPVTGEILTNPDGTSVKETKEVLMPAFKVVNVSMSARLTESLYPLSV